MDINGAKALKKRLGLNGSAKASPAAVDVDVPENAPPVYHWLGVSHAAPETLPDDADDEPAGQAASLFRRLGLSFR
jgi:hypothetical protein